VQFNNAEMLHEYPLLCLQRQVAKFAKAAFFSHFAAAETFTNVCIGHGTLRQRVP